MRYYFAVVGAIFIAGALWLFVRRVGLAGSGVSTTGRIEGFEVRDIDDSISYLPVVSFTDHAGRAHRFTSVAGRSGPMPPVGTAVKVRYDRSNPSFALISSFLHMWAAPLALAVLGFSSLLAFWQ